MRRTWAVAIVTVFALCELSGWTAGLWAQPPGPSARHTPPGSRLERLVEELGLDARTLARVDALIDTSRAKKRTLRRQLREAHEQMHSMLEEEAPGETALLAQVDRIGRLRTELRKEQLKTMLRVRALLSPEQRARLLERLNKSPGRGRRGFGRHEDFQSSLPPDKSR